VTLSLWRTREYAYDTGAGYPKTFSVDSDATSHSIDLTNLIPGQYYHILLEAQDVGESDYSSDTFEIEIAQTLCGCLSSETTGMPTDLTISQYLGKIQFEWIDESYCEDSFTFLRDGVAFTSSYSVAPIKVCSQDYFPKTVYDDIVASSSVEVGKTYQYCISATSSNEVSWAIGLDGVSSKYSSDPVCEYFEVKWEAVISGTVQLTDEAGQLPVAETTVSYNIGSGKVTGTTTTGSDGKFEIYIHTSVLTNEYEAAIITVSKTSSSISHTYECHGVPCTS
jgi:hypothetical protein